MKKKNYYHYIVFESKSKTFPTGFEFLSKEKKHDGRTKNKEGHFADLDCNTWKFKLLHMCNGHPKKTKPKNSLINEDV